ncbi:MAG: SGNH/GDSL hydrolase family protein [Bacteroidetes bacterium]|nr:SGNH/GDSL hydrolase family protein [Bacteroidota bacterium]
MKTVLKKFLSIVIGILCGLIICEIFLHFYNPFPFAISRGRLVLPANQKTVFKNTWLKKLDNNIYYSRNSLGFRGPEPTDSINKLLSVICIGGSTTECRFISDSLTWSYQLYLKLKTTNPSIWLNNAGIDGHSTFGHLLLLKEYIIRLKPKYVVFLIGANDIETDKPEQFDLMNEKKINFSSVKGFLKSVANKTELGSSFFQLYAIRGAYKKGLIHKNVDFASLRDTVLQEQYIAMLLKKQDYYLQQYKARITELISLCKMNNIKPILLTQPSMFGNYIDSTTMVNMTDKIIPESDPMNTAGTMQQELELYNNVLRSFGSEVKVIDLDSLMPKNSKYYYDFFHFTNAGCTEVASLLADKLSDYIKTDHQ